MNAKLKDRETLQRNRHSVAGAIDLPRMRGFFSRTGKEEAMEGVLFIVLWIGCASLHTLYDIKVRPLVRTWGREEDIS